MEPDSSAPPKAATRRVKFTPKAPQAQRKAKLLPKVEKVEDEFDAAQAEEMLRHFNEASLKGKPKVERKVGPAQVAFGHTASATPTRSYGGPNGAGIHHSSTSEPKVEKQYKEPWDYYTYYPVTLPLRRPYSGNPEHLDMEEFGEAAESLTYDESSANTGFDLGLMEENVDESLFFMQLPKYMPLLKQSLKTKQNDMANSSKASKNVDPSQKACTWDELTAGSGGNGFMGKMYVYRSGAVKMKLGDTLYGVSSGLDSVFAQDAVAVDTEDKRFCSLGELNKRVTVTPEFDFLDSTSDI